MTVGVLSNRVLVLNKLWTPVGTCSIQRAISLLFGEYNDGEPKAKIIDPSLDFQTFTWSDWAELKPNEEDICIHSSDMKFKLPEVVLLTKYDKMPNQKVRFCRRTLYKRDNNRCQYCGIRPGSGEVSIDHVIPKSRNGKTTWENCVLACTQCNSQKGDKLPEEAFKGSLPKESAKNWRGPSPMRLIKLPKKPRYSLLGAYKTRIPNSWSHFISEAYWETEMENDNEM